MYTLLGDTSAAVSQLATYLNANPGKKVTFATDPGWWLRPIMNAPSFRRLVGAETR